MSAWLHRTLRGATVRFRSWSQVRHARCASLRTTTSALPPGRIIRNLPDKILLIVQRSEWRRLWIVALPAGAQAEALPAPGEAKFGLFCYGRHKGCTHDYSVLRGCQVWANSLASPNRVPGAVT